MAKKRKNKAASVIVVILLLLLIIPLLSFFLQFTDGGKIDFKTFYVQSGDTIYVNTSTLELTPGETFDFECKYLFESSDKPEEYKGYTLKVIPNVTNETSFVFYVNQKSYSFLGEREKDYSEAFGITLKENGFTIKGEEMNIEKVLQNQYPGKNVEVFADCNTASKTYFNLVISSYDGSQSVIFALRFYSPCARISISETAIIF